MIDLRSDTVTQPSAQMRHAMAHAEVGDDVYGEDPTVNHLQELAAAMTGKQAALLVPSGTMANQLALGVLARPGDQVVVGWGSHCFHHEAGAGAALNGLQFQEVGKSGRFSARELEAAFQPPVHPHAATTLVALENTHNQGGGSVWDVHEMEQVCGAARRLGMALHLDGARLFNAVVQSGVSAERWCAPFDTVAICLSKGLGAPVGSLLCASHEIVARARRRRQMFGGAMRQAGVLAAAGLYALQHNVKRLVEDHDNARSFAELLVTCPQIELDLETVQTNMVWFGVKPDGPSAAVLAGRAKARGVLLHAVAPQRLRAVTHLDVDRAAVTEAARILLECIAIG